jgi:hypothetical protein
MARRPLVAASSRELRLGAQDPRVTVVLMDDALIGLAGAVVGGGAAVAGAALQARSAASLHRRQAEDEERRRHSEAAERLQERQRALARRYLFQLGEAVDSLLHRVDNWLRRGGKPYAGALNPGYWETTTLYVFARALGAERILSLDAVYLDLQALWPKGHTSLSPRAVERAVADAVGGGWFQYDRLGLAEAALTRADDGFRLLIYSEFRLRFDDPGWHQFLEAARETFNSLTEHQLTMLEDQLIAVKAQIDAATSTGTSAI